MKAILIYITHASESEAKKISTHLVSNRFVACANIFPINSVYFWDGKLNSDNEYVSILKTRKENWKKVKKEIENIHTYEIPCIIKIPIKANTKYIEWIYSMTN